MSEIHDKRLAGFRSWRVDEEGRLTALHRGAAWEPGENKATCPTHGDKAPVVGCRCGFNAFYRFAEWERQEGAGQSRGGVSFSITSQGAIVGRGGGFDPLVKVCGIASASGRAILHETGWHASTARVEAIVAYRTDVPALGGTVSVRPLLEALAGRYGVPLLEPDEAEAFCAVEGLELLEPMVGAESELVVPESPFGFYAHQVVFSNPSFKRAIKRFEEIANRYQQHGPDKPGNFQEAVEAKKNRGKFYDGLDTKKGLDKPNKRK